MLPLYNGALPAFLYAGQTTKIEAGKRADAMTRARQKHQRCEEERTGSSVSGYGSEERCRISGMNRHLIKPLSEEKLVSTLREVL